MTPRKEKAFTLIELLVVIAIIAMLLAVLMPALGKAKEHAMSILCKNNLHQYSLGMAMYLHENENKYPLAWTFLYETRPTGWCQWHDTVNTLDNSPDLRGPMVEYLGTGKIHQCPYFRKAAQAVSWRHDNEEPNHDILGKEIQFSYTMNAFLGYAEGSATGIGVMKSTQITRSPSVVFMFGEENPWASRLQSDYPNDPYDYDQAYSNRGMNDGALFVVKKAGSVAPGADARDCFASFHSAPSGNYGKGKSNVLFVDGHLELASPADSYKYASPRNNIP